jgi:tetratricopeptide (TPR) repeat protein
MQNLITRMSMLVIAFGFFISCSKAYEPVYTPQREASAQELLDQAAELKAQNPQSTEAIFLEGQAYSKLAREKSPTNRQDDYTAMKDAFQRVQIQSASDRSARARIDAITQTLSTTWSLEHNSGAGIISSDSTRSNQQLRTALAHAQNAVVIQPDSLISYELLADTYALLGDTESAIQTLVTADSLHSPVSQRIHEHIGFLYLNSDNAEEAVSWYESALLWQQSRAERAVDPGEPTLQRGSLINTWHGLVNAYIAANQPENAISSLEQLLEVSPANSSYKNILASQLISRIAAQFEKADSPDRSTIINTLDKLNELSKTEPETLLTTASNLTALATSTVESKLAENESYAAADDLDIMLICDAAISMYQEVLSVDNSNITAISGLADTYLVLGNEEEASRWFELLN